jgi:hypothetical protein
LILRDFLSLTAQSYAVTAAKQLAMPVLATGIVVGAIAVANAEAVPGAIPPDRVLHEPRERRREGRIELPGINVGSQLADNAGAPAWLVAPVPIRVVGA